MEKFKVIEQEVEEIISAGQLQQILNTNAGEVSKLCQRACLKPKKDGLGNLYFSKTDIDVLRKVKELYEHTAQIQAKKQTATAPQEQAEQESLPNNFLTRAKTRLKNELGQGATFNGEALSASMVNTSLAHFENSIVERISSILSEKMDGLDEVVVELIRSKTENETLRQKLNELNKENFNLKNENTSYKSVGLGLYIKKNTDDFVL